MLWLSMIIAECSYQDFPNLATHAIFDNIVASHIFLGVLMTHVLISKRKGTNGKNLMATD